MSIQGNKITGVIEEDKVILEFGKHEGKSLKEVADIDPEFYEYLVQIKDNGNFSIRRHKDKTFRLYLNPLSKMDH